MAELLMLDEVRLTESERAQAQSDLAAFVLGSLDPESLDVRTLNPNATFNQSDWGDPTATFTPTDWGGPADPFPQSS